MIIRLCFHFCNYWKQMFLLAYSETPTQQVTWSANKWYTKTSTSYKNGEWKTHYTLWEFCFLFRSWAIHICHNESEKKVFAKVILWSLVPCYIVLSMQFRITNCTEVLILHVVGLAVYSHVLLLSEQDSLKISFEMSTNCETFILIDVWKTS